MKLLLSVALLLFGGCAAFSVSPGAGPNTNTLTTTALFSIKSSKSPKKKTYDDSFIAETFENLDLESGNSRLIDIAVEKPKETLSGMMINQMFGSMMIYTFATVRDYVRTHPEHNWYKPGLILTQQGYDEEPQDVDSQPPPKSEKATFKGGVTGFDGGTTYTRYLKRPITADHITEFLNDDHNRKILEANIKKSDLDFNSKLGPLELLKRLGRFKGEIVEFNDHFSDHELVYGLTVNRSNKRITVCFRGTVWDNSDPEHDFMCEPKSIDIPEVLYDKGWRDEAIKVHTGLHEYLFHETGGKPGERCFKIDDILGQILELYETKEFADYDLYICGHSLGGSLSTLLSFFLASSGKLDRPIKNLTFASYRVGTEGFMKAFQKLEESNLVYHARVSNQGDVVPCFPTKRKWPYGHTGVNLHLYENSKMEIAYRNDKTLLSQLGPLSKQRHSLKSYFRRFHKRKENKIELDSKKSLKGLYKVNN